MNERVNSSNCKIKKRQIKYQTCFRCCLTCVAMTFHCSFLMYLKLSFSLRATFYLSTTVSNLYVHEDVHSPGRKEEGLVRYQQRHSFFKHRRYFAWIYYILLHLFTLVLLSQLALFIDCFLSFICQTYFWMISMP